MSRNFTYISSCNKWTLFIFNFLFWIFGLTIIAIGCYGVYFTAEEMQGVESVKVLYIIATDISGVLLALGAVIFMVSFAGCIGALRENTCLLKLYFWLLTLILILELVVAIACILFPWKSREIVEHFLSQRLIQDYRESENTKNFVDSLQMNSHCCGMTGDGYLDWNANEYFNCSDSSPSAEKCGVPHSCCINFAIERNTMCGYGMLSKSKNEAAEYIYTGGCVAAIIYIFESNLYVAAGIIFALALFQMYVTHQARTLIDQISLQRSRWMRNEVETLKLLGIYSRSS